MVSLQAWIEIQAGPNIGLNRIQHTRDTTSGPGGGFRFCNLPPGVNGVARAVVSTADSNAVSRPVALNGRLVTALVLHVPGTLKPAASSSHGTASSDGSAAPSEGSVLRGRVMRPENAGPLSGAQVTVLGSRITTVTNDSGEFTLRGLPTGSRTLAVRAVGWQPVTMPVDLAVHAPQQVVVPLQIRTASLQAVVVTAALNTGLKRVGFDTRKHMGIGHFIDPDDIERRGSFEFVDIMSGTPGIVRRPGPFGEDYLAGTRGVSGCVGYIVDGVPYAEMTRGDINTFVRAEEVGAVEVYQAAEGAAQPMVTSQVVIMNTAGSGRRAGSMDGNAARTSGIGRSGGSGGGATGCVRIVIWTKAHLALEVAHQVSSALNDRQRGPRMIPDVRRHTIVLARLLATACTLAAAAPARSQTTPAPAPAPGTRTGHAQFGAITGTVIDSLHGRPLAGAQISVEGFNSLAMTDSAGRFRIDSVPPGKYRIGVFHPLLDSLALSIASPQLQVSADSTLSVIFATPSTVTFIRLVCGPIQIDTMAGIGPSVVEGRVLDAETDAPAGGIKVSLNWTEVQAGASVGVHRIQRERDTTSGPAGDFRFCHLPPNLSGVARAASSATDSSAVSRPLTLGGHLVTTLVLHVPGKAKPALNGTNSSSHGTASDGSAAPAAGSVLTGRVTRADGTGPFAGARVTVFGSSASTVSDDSGRFTLHDLPSGSRTLAVRAIGWQPVLMPVDLAMHTPLHVAVPLQTRTADLQAVVVTGTFNASLKRVGFASRQHTGVGRFLGPADIQKRDAFEFADILDGMPGLARHRGPYGDDYLAGPGGASGCVGYVVDGAPYLGMTSAETSTHLCGPRRSARSRSVSARRGTRAVRAHSNPANRQHDCDNPGAGSVPGRLPGLADDERQQCY